ncbi:putative cytochrome P450 [Lentithecium fluviatile CBS 122367]|uniref:Putative cytochrome P450 n=1 Tax=Lentithecium fluviatile CBS 122367 TaxID=1168545 RepID=A0A6G1JAY4_9PLEO|nr:putative cytochrome P450 [Lentithecium fluviatile CBS 122367]
MFFFLLASCVFLFVAFYAAWSTITLEQNYRRASTMGIPLVRIPVDPLNIPWQVIEPHFWKFIDFFHIPMPRNSVMLRRGWHFRVKAEMHEEMGTLWAFVTPRDIHLNVCDADALREIYARRGDFVRPREFYELLAAYGPCVSTVGPEEWGRQRKILAAPFQNESIMGYVWNESISQAQQMVEAWTKKGAMIRVAKDTRTLSLNVLAAIGFRKSFKFESSESKNTGSADESFSYRDALQMVLDNAILVMVVGRTHLLYSWLPAWIRRIGKAADDFQKHMEKMLEEEMASLNRGEKGTGTIMTNFVRALDQHQQDPTKGMSAEEVFGNTFVINFAGHDTTANSFSFAVLLLGANPDVQEWVAEELKRVIAGSTDGSWDYATLFPKLVRCRAVLLETLRLFPPIMSLPKATNDQPQKLTAAGRTVIVPPKTGVFGSVLGTHTYPGYWPDPLAWKPSRWIELAASGEETVMMPNRITYFPWSDGLQNCPGQKFSQVEFVAVVATLLNEHRIRPQRKAGESVEDMQKRVRGVANDCDAIMILRVRDADQVRVKLERV